MKGYNYYEAVREDVKRYIDDEINLEDWAGDADGLKEKLEEDLWIDDSVTGNGSGSYTFNGAKAKEYVVDNVDLLAEAVEEFGTPKESIADDLLNENWEELDVTIRCYLLSGVINDVVDEMEVGES